MRHLVCRRPTLALSIWLLVAWSTGPGPAAAAETEPPPPPPIALPNARTPLPGVLTGGQPTPEQLGEAARAGYRTIVNLRTPGEIDWDEARAVETLGMRYVSIPVAGAAGLTEENAVALSRVLHDPEAGPMVIHCHSGNRVGALLALEARHQGASAADALQLGLEAGLTRLEETVRQKLQE